MLFYKTPPTTSYTYNHTSNTHNFFESFEQKDGENRTWTYVNKPKEYRVTANDNRVVISSAINGKKQEATLFAENALKVQNLFKKMIPSAAPVRPIKPIMPIKPIAPILLSFNDPRETKKEADQYFRELNNYKIERQKEIYNYKYELENYKKETAAHVLNKKKNEAVRKDLINLIESFISLRNESVSP